MPDFNITKETSKTFRRFEKTEIKYLENEIISKTKRNFNMLFQKSLLLFRKKCKTLFTTSYVNNKIHTENLEKERRRKYSINDQFFKDLQKISTQRSCHPQAEESEDHQELASMEYNINPSKHSQGNQADAEPSNTKTRDTIPKNKTTKIIK